MNYINKYFPYISKHLYSKLKIDDIGLYSISTPKNADTISKIIKSYFLNKNIVITDAMASVGGNTLSFSNYFYYVNAIEIDSKRFNYLVSNINLYNKNNIICINENYIDIIYKIYQDVIFIDPPWGGKTYKDFETIQLTINDIELETLCYNISKQKICKMLILKLPLNYNTNKFSTELKAIMVKYKLSKMLIIIFILT
jgi:16S rRNA G966 N2-methylase RsmD